MIRLLFTALLCALASSQATAQNWVSEALLGLNEDQRNETFTYLLRDGNAKCDWVIRTLFIGSTVKLDDWEVLCRDRNSYSLTITPEQTPSIELVSWPESLRDLADFHGGQRQAPRLKGKGWEIAPGLRRIGRYEGRSAGRLRASSYPPAGRAGPPPAPLVFHSDSAAYIHLPRRNPATNCETLAGFSPQTAKYA